MDYTKKIVDPDGIIQNHYISQDNSIWDSEGHLIGHIEGEIVNLDYKKCIDLQKLKFEIVELRGEYTGERLIINGRQLNVESVNQ